MDQQINLLVRRGLKVDNLSEAKKFLLLNNYYRISGYTLTLRNHDEFYPGVSFQNVMDIYRFDAGLRNILLKYIEIIENSIKSVYAYRFAEMYGTFGYTTSNRFTDPKEYLRIRDKADDQGLKRLSHEAFLKHFIEEKKSEIPFWAYVDLFTISDISILYSISLIELKVKVAADFSILNNNASELMGKFLHAVTILRNLCAHGSRLYNRLFITKPSLNSKEKRLLIKDENGNADNSHLFGYLLNMRRVLQKEQFADMIFDIRNLCNIYPFVKMKYYGVPDNWENIL